MTLTEIVGWSLVHSLWVGAAVAGLLFLLLRVIDERRAALRYGVSCAALLILAVVPVGAALRMQPHVRAQSAFNTDAGPDALVASDQGPSASPSPSGKKHRKAENQLPVLPEATASDTASLGDSSILTLRLRPLFPWMVLLWVIGVVILSARLIATWLQVQRLRTQGTAAVGPAHAATLQRVLGLLAISRPVQLLQSTLVQVPAVIGWLRPIVLIPVTLLNGLTVSQLEAILAHELAHIRRHDYLVNLAQVVIETLLFYHPAAWWISRQVRDTREHCCDDLAVQVAGNPADYARALLALEEQRVLALLPAASGGDLLGRVRRLVAPRLSHAETFPRWVAAVVGVAAVITLGGGARLAGKGGVIEGQQEAGSPVPVFSSQSAPVSPDTVIRHPDPSAPLARRWEWARQLGAANHYKAFWIGYTIAPMPALQGTVFISRMERRGILGPGGMDLRGRISNFGNFNGFSVPGVLLPRLVGGGEADDVALLFAYALDNTGSPVLARVQISSLALPVDLEDRPLLWLGSASDEESVPLALSLYQAAPSKLKEDVVAAVGVHGDRLAIPPLVRWLSGDEPTNTRTEAAEWLGRHADPEALRALARAARNDRVSDVRKEAAESVGEMRLNEATDTLIALARTLPDREARQEAVEGLAERNDPKSLAAAGRIAREDVNQDVRQEAVETLGEFSGAAGLPDLLQIAHDDRSSDIRQEAVETIGEAAEPDAAIRILMDIIRTERSENVQREAVETLGDVESPKVAGLLRELATSNLSSAVRAEAVETLGQVAPDATTADVLQRIALQDANEDVQHEAVETLGELKDPVALEMVSRIAREHPRAEIRKKAIETLGQGLEPEEAIRALKSLANGDKDAEVQAEAVETMGELPADIAIPALIEIARNHPNPEVRAEAIETLGDSQGEDPRSLEAIIAIARNERNQQVSDKAVETLGDMGTPEALNVVAEVASKHPDSEIRRQAVEAIGQSDDHVWAIQELTRIARGDDDLEVRGEAIETLAEVESSAAVANTLAQIAMSDPSEELEQKALETLADLDDDLGIPAVIKAARTHPNRELRQKALEILGDSDSPLAQQVIDSMLR
ncbi:MAG TPA: HEAT repeat domain-containing protein [Gemmatimonadales bacterium]|nr:HEAT repeat domain-containing protein [Gemmatimonadales bacterium]